MQSSIVQNYSITAGALTGVSCSVDLLNKSKLNSGRVSKHGWKWKLRFGRARRWGYTTLQSDASMIMTCLPCVCIRVTNDIHVVDLQTAQYSQILQKGELLMLSLLDTDGLKSWCNLRDRTSQSDEYLLLLVFHRTNAQHGDSSNSLIHCSCTMSATSLFLYNVSYIQSMDEIDITPCGHCIPRWGCQLQQSANDMDRNTLPPISGTWVSEQWSSDWSGHEGSHIDCAQ